MLAFFAFFALPSSLPLALASGLSAQTTSAPDSASSTTTHRAHARKPLHSKSASEAPLQPTVPQPPAAPLTPAQQPPIPALVSFTRGEVLVTANNSDLNQTLVQISQAAGIKLTGTAGESRVFGTYGPGNPSDVLTSLIDGTGTNMLFVQGSGAVPAELILSPRTGEATPPSPKPPTEGETANTDQDQNAAQPAPPIAIQPLQPPGAMTNPYRPGAPGSPGASGASGASDPNQPSPNGVKTPQQIFEQLQRMRQQQQQSGAAPQ